MLSSLDSRYSTQLHDIADYLGDEAFVYYMSLWSITYAEATNKGVFLPAYEDRGQLYDRVKKFEIETKHQMTALIRVLEQDFPGVKTHFGLTSEDIMLNSRVIQTNLVITQMLREFRKIEEQIQRFESQVQFPILGHTHGQSATPIYLGAYLRAKVRDIFLARPNYRLGGSNGQLTILKLVRPEVDPHKLSKIWMKRMTEKLQDPMLFDDCEFAVPSKKVGLLQVGPHNDATYVSGMSMALKLRALSRAFWDHAHRKILNVGTTSRQTGSSAMPHKVNPIGFENAEGCFSNAYHILLGALEANCDSRGLRDLSNSVVNRHALDGWAYLYLGVRGLVRAMENSNYSPERCLAELHANPDCLTEILRYHIMEKEGKDPYFELKNSPPDDFGKTIKRVSWDLGWGVIDN